MLLAAHVISKRLDTPVTIFIPPYEMHAHSYWSNRDRQTDKECPHGIIFTVQKDRDSPLLAYHELTQYHLVTQRAVVLRNSETRNASRELLLYDCILR